MKRIVHPPSFAKTEKGPEAPVISDISVDSLISDALLALYREIKNLLMASARGKLEAADAKDLRDHTKMLFEIKDRENRDLSSLSQEDVEKLLALVRTPNGPTE